MMMTVIMMIMKINVMMEVRLVNELDEDDVMMCEQEKTKKTI